MSSHHTKRPVARIRWRKNQALVEPVTPTLLELHERLEAVERDLDHLQTVEKDRNTRAQRRYAQAVRPEPWANR